MHMNDKETKFKWGTNYSWRLDFWRKFNLNGSNYRTLNLILSAKLFLSLCRLHQERNFCNFLTISQTCLPCLPIRWVSPCVLSPLVIGLTGGSVDAFLRMVSMVLDPCRFGAFLGNRYGIRGENYVALFQGSKITEGFHYRDWILDI